MKLTTQDWRVLATIKSAPWRLYATDREAKALVRAGLIAASEQWADGSELYRITPAGRQALATREREDE